MQEHTHTQCHYAHTHEVHIIIMYTQTHVHTHTHTHTTYTLVANNYYYFMCMIKDMFHRLSDTRLSDNHPQSCGCLTTIVLVDWQTNIRTCDACSKLRLKNIMHTTHNFGPSPYFGFMDLLYDCTFKLVAMDDNYKMYMSTGIA